MTGILTNNSDEVRDRIVQSPIPDDVCAHDATSVRTGFIPAICESDNEPFENSSNNKFLQRDSYVLEESGYLEWGLGKQVRRAF